jgi:hypothetical protein
MPEVLLFRALRQSWQLSLEGKSAPNLGLAHTAGAGDLICSRREIDCAVRVVEVHDVKNIRCLAAKLKRQVFMDPKITKQGKIYVPRAGTPKAISFRRPVRTGWAGS